MRAPRRAVGYVCDIPIPGTDLTITKEYQRQRIMEYAKRENVEVVCVVEDEEYTEDFVSRPGVQELLNFSEGYGMLLVERVWVLSRKRRDLAPFLVMLDVRNARLTSASYLWDCLSQHVRHRYMGALASRQKEEVRALAKATQIREAA